MKESPSLVTQVAKAQVGQGRLMSNVVCTSKARGVGPYSQAVRGGGFIFVSGQLALDPVTRQIIEGDARQQTERALQNIAAVLEASGSNLDKVVRCGVFLKTWVTSTR